MEVRKGKCYWCEGTYALKDSTASDREMYCSENCEAECKMAAKEYDKLWHEIVDEWHKYEADYEPEEDEGCPWDWASYGSEFRTIKLHSRRKHLAFKKRYQKWKTNHCWKESFWAWDEDSDESPGGSFFGGGGGDGGSSASGCFMAALKLIGIAVAVWIGWLVLKGLWNGIFHGGEDEVVTEAAIMEKWEKHLEKRREAFDDGKPEKEIEAKGLRNYTWDEWQEKFRKEHESADKPKAEKKELLGGGEDSAVKKAKEIGDQAMSAAKGLGDKAKEIWQNVTAKEEKDPESELKRLNARLAELEGRSNSGETTDVENIGEKYREHQQRRSALLNSGLTDRQLDAMGYADYTYNGFKKNYKNIKYKTLEEIRQDSESSARPVVAPEKTAEPKDATSSTTAEAVARAKVAAEDKAKAEAEARARAEAEAKRLAEELARKGAEEKVRAEEQARAKKKAEAKAKAESEARARAEAEAKRLAEELARKEAEEKSRAREEARAKIEAEAKAKAEAEAKARAVAEAIAKAEVNADASVEPEGFADGQQDGDMHKASMDSKGIRIVVQGKGKTKDAAVRWAIRDAVWKTVGKWVDSKARIQENHDKVVAKVKTITEADVAKYELIDSQKLDDDYIVKVRVSVSKKRIAPKFAEIFPDVFGNE